jgi:hypothetical protein
VAKSPEADTKAAARVPGVLRVDADGVRTKRQLALLVKRGVDDARSPPLK